MKNNSQSKFDKLISRTPAQVKKFVDLSFDIVDEVDNKLKNDGKTRSDLASLLNKNESEISKILSGMHNTTIKSVCKIAAILDMDILTTPSKEAVKYASEIDRLEKRVKELEEELSIKRQVERITLISSRIRELQYGVKSFTYLKSKSEEVGSWNLATVGIRKKTETYAEFEIDKENKNLCETLG